MNVGAATDCGARMFARYAHAPNRLGYCGPPDSEALLSGSYAHIEAMARQFSGAWPYLQVLSRMTGIADPLDHRLVESYWLGGGVGAHLDNRAFARELLEVIGPQAGHYWSHLTEDLAEEAAAHHSFHVLGVYPWSRLLAAGAGEHPLSVLDNCRISWGTVVSVDGQRAGHVDVERRRLRWDGSALTLSEPVVDSVLIGLPETDETRLSEGDCVAVHWDRICDLLSQEQVDDLSQSTQRQLTVTSLRLARRPS